MRAKVIIIIICAQRDDDHRRRGSDRYASILSLRVRYSLSVLFLNQRLLLATSFTLNHLRTMVLNKSTASFSWFWSLVLALAVALQLLLVLGVAVHPVHGFVPPSAPSRILLSQGGLPITTQPNPNSHDGGKTRSIVLPAPLHATGAAVAGTAAKRGAVVKNSFVKGKLTLFLSKFIISPRKAVHIAHRLALVIKKDFLDLVLIVAVYQLVLPLAKKFYARRHADMLASGDAEKFETQFERSKTNRTAQLAQEVAFLLGLLYGFEIGLVLLDELGFEFVREYPVYQWISGLVASWWGARNMSEFKDFVLSRGNRIDINKSAGRRLASRFLDILIYGGTTLVIFDFLSIQTGFALRSIFGLSSVGTLVFSLASKELVSEFLASLAIQGTNMYSEGERILLSDGTQGTVQKLGWLNTHLRRGDELVVRIPNTQISGTRVANISRSRLSTVKQTLAISYDHVDQLPELIEDIKTEIRKSCPALIDDGSRSFQVFFTEYKEYSVEVVVSAHFRTKPFCDAFWEVKQEVLLAIRRAMKKNNVNFSYVNFLQSGIPMMDNN